MKKPNKQRLLELLSETDWLDDEREIRTLEICLEHPVTYAEVWPTKSGKYKWQASTHGCNEYGEADTEDEATKEVRAALKGIIQEHAEE